MARGGCESAITSSSARLDTRALFDYSRDLLVAGAQTLRRNIMPDMKSVQPMKSKMSSKIGLLI